MFNVFAELSTEFGEPLGRFCVQERLDLSGENRSVRIAAAIERPPAEAVPNGAGGRAVR
jgi:hypothetical protein